ncbi:hypothetical protein [Cupriavidus basilensis]|uniref:Uncharacterized protein n=1 Tax=Cupriavidus basilensis TaxID=68895 RepID=A0A643FPY0_9BURK|nr:hypothetical protein [Cupriavidus basilensis]QOT74909.1 hypothetical protein F7R26_011635 [Cupriavidus basilensis]
MPAVRLLLLHRVPDLTGRRSPGHRLYLPVDGALASRLPPDVADLSGAAFIIERAGCKKIRISGLLAYFTPPCRGWSFEPNLLNRTADGERSLALMPAWVFLACIPEQRMLPDDATMKYAARYRCSCDCMAFPGKPATDSHSYLSEEVTDTPRNGASEDQAESMRGKRLR